MYNYPNSKEVLVDFIGEMLIKLDIFAMMIDHLEIT